MGTLSGEVTMLFTYFLPFTRGFTLKGKSKQLLLEQIYSFKSEPKFERAVLAREANMK